MEYECIGVCQPDPVTGLCEGCGYPYFDPAAGATAADTAACSAGCAKAGSSECKSSHNGRCTAPCSSS